MSRLLQGTDEIVFAAGAIAGSSRAGTLLILARDDNAGGGSWFSGGPAGLATGSPVWGVWMESGQQFANGDEFGGGQSTFTHDGTYYIWGWTKASGSAPVRYHKATVGGAWSHQDGGTRADGPGGTDAVLMGHFERNPSLRVAAIARWLTAQDDTAVEALGTTDMADWLAGAPDWAVQFNQASTSDPVLDLTGGGGDQTSITGTAVGGDDPAGWSYFTAPSEVDGSGSAALGGITATGAGQRLKTGAGVATLGAVTATAAGSRAKAGTGTATLGAIHAAGIGDGDIAITTGSLTAGHTEPTLTAASTTRTLTASHTP